MCGSFCFVIALKMGVQIVFFIPIQMKGGVQMIVSKFKIKNCERLTIKSQVKKEKML